MKARVPVVLMAVIRQPDGTYNLLSSELMEMKHHAERDTETLQNAEKVLKQAEEFIRLAPQQWNVPLPVWPDLMKMVPN
jgi:lauroyl/myristoyl acyltransferase